MQFINPNLDLPETTLEDVYAALAAERASGGIVNVQIHNDTVTWLRSYGPDAAYVEYYHAHRPLNTALSGIRIERNISRAGVARCPKCGDGTDEINRVWLVQRKPTAQNQQYEQIMQHGKKICAFLQATQLR